MSRREGTLRDALDLGHLREDYAEIRDGGEEGCLAALAILARLTWDTVREETPVGARYRELRNPPKMMYWMPRIELKLERRNPLFWLVLLFGSTDWGSG